MNYSRRLNGFDFENIVIKPIRNGATQMEMPCITGKVSCKDSDVSSTVEEWKRAQALTSTPVKVTIPGPMTIIGSTTSKAATFFFSVLDIPPH